MLYLLMYLSNLDSCQASVLYSNFVVAHSCQKKITRLTILCCGGVSAVHRIYYEMKYVLFNKIIPKYLLDDVTLVFNFT